MGRFSSKRVVRSAAERKNSTAYVKLAKMVQTKTGAANSAWLKFIRECAVEYHARRKAEALAAEAANEGLTPCTCPAKRGRGRPKTIRDNNVTKS